MSKKVTKLFNKEIFINPLKKIYAANKIVVFWIDDTWINHLLYLHDYGAKNNEGFR